MKRLQSKSELDSQLPEVRASFSEMKLATAKDYESVHKVEEALEFQVADRLLAYLMGLDVSNGTPISILHHCLMTATLAAEDGRSDEYVACALLHDIGDVLCPLDHGAFAGALVKPYVSEAHWFMTRYHPEFQMANQVANPKADPDIHRRHSASPYFELTHEFCRLYDQRAFDPALPAADLAEFAPLLRKVFSLKPSRAQL